MAFCGLNCIACVIIIVFVFACGVSAWVLHLLSVQHADLNYVILVVRALQVFQSLLLLSSDCNWNFSSSIHKPHDIFSKFCLEPTSLSLYCYALACVPNMAATLRAFLAEYDF